jgi:hypothetical protein
METTGETVETSDPEVVSAIDNRELRGVVFKKLPGLTTAARVLTRDLEKWRAERPADSASVGPSE